jgi:shikimate dehydrogenase
MLVEPSDLIKNLVVMDANYRDSQLLSMASEKGCRLIDGLDWLFYQALPSLELLVHKKVPRHVEKKIRERLPEAPNTEKTSIAFIGFMGSGKTHMGRALAAKTAKPFIDTDDLIEEKVGLSIPRIFREKGEDFFRQAEKCVIRRVLSDSGKSVISFGGGCVLDPETRSLIRNHCLTIWLWVTPETTLKRIDLSSRPLLSVPQTKEKATSMLEQRKFLYAKTADLVIDAETREGDNLAQRIVDEMD